MYLFNFFFDAQLTHRGIHAQYVTLATFVVQDVCKWRSSNNMYGEQKVIKNRDFWMASSKSFVKWSPWQDQFFLFVLRYIICMRKIKWRKQTWFTHWKLLDHSYLVVKAHSFGPQWEHALNVVRTEETHFANMCANNFMQVVYSTSWIKDTVCPLWACSVFKAFLENIHYTFNIH